MRNLFAQDIRLPFSPWWLLWTAALAVGFLIPNRSLPWISFDRELVAVACEALLVGGLLLRMRGPWSVPVACMVLMVLVAVPIAQSASGRIYFAGDAWVVSLYFVGFAFAIAAGAQASKVFGNELLEALFAGFLVAALVSVGIAMYQWLRLTWMDYLVIDMHAGDRPFSNLGQPNHLATLLGWGLVSVWWMYLRRHVGASVASVAAAFLLFGLAMTQSRTGWVYAGVLLAGGVCYRSTLETRRYRFGLVSLAALFAWFVVIWGPLNRALHFDLAFGLQQRLQPGTRLHHWQEMVSAILERPLFGWGWNQVVVAQQAVALRFPASPELIDHSHNVILDLLVWNGLLIGVPLVIAGAWWMALLARRVRTVEGILSMMAVGALVVHALVEYPHSYAFFLLPAGLLLGIAWSSLDRGKALQISRTLVAVVAIASGAVYGWIAVEYYEAKHNLEVLRFESAHIGTSRDSTAPKLAMLTQLEAFLVVNRIKPSEKATPERLELMRKVSERYPHHLLQLRYAMAAASVGKIDVAQDTLARLCKLQTPDDCTRSIDAWRELAQTTYPYLKGVELPVR